MRPPILPRPVRMSQLARLSICAALLAASASACTGASPPPCPPPSPTGAPTDETPDAETPPTAADADAFVKRYNEEGAVIALEGAKAAWVQQTYITPDTQFLSGKAQERWLTFRGGMIEDSKRFSGMTLTGETGRALLLIKQGVTMPAPRDPALVAELAGISTKLESMYGTGKYCDTKGNCQDLEALSKIMAKSHDYDELLDAWRGWRTISPAMRPSYARFATLMNEGARELGFADTGALWKSGYDMSADDFEKEADRLWGQVKPLYEQLHCYVRAKLGKVYGKDKVPPTGPIPAHLLGNMWAQEWNNIYDLVKPYPVGAKLDIDKAIEKKKWGALDMVKSAESFYTSMGLSPLPKSFYEQSLFTKPRDREVVCHASAWDIDPPNGDLRIKMCIDQTEEDLVTIYHELGHIYYYIYYKDQPFVFQSGAHDGFHEAIGDALTLSMTPKYYQEVGLIKGYGEDDEALINYQLKLALEKIAFLPFGKLVDQWRWDVFSGKTKPEEFNAAWWKLREQYQGIVPPITRSEANFDPGAKYHIPANTPYTRYFLARILQFQFHRAMCQAAGQKGPLHACSIYGSKEAGKRLSEMLAMGQSKPWPDALEKLTGTRTMDASAIIDYFAPLMEWLKKENAGQKCGW
ncbi:MAG: M2 family metallopeptidase [Polyangiaceae bacterium]